MIAAFALLALAQAAAPAPTLEARLRTIAAEARARFGLPRVAVSVVDLAGNRRADVDGDARFYAASLIKLPFAIAFEDARSRGRIEPTELIWRDLHAMLSVSSNQAANRILDLACGTTGGERLGGQPLREFVRRRGCVQRSLRRRGLRAIRAAHKLTYTTPRDRQLYRYRPVNSVTANAMARLFTLFVRGQVLPADTPVQARILEGMKREPGVAPPSPLAPDERGRLFALLNGGARVDAEVERSLWRLMREDGGHGHPIDAPIASAMPSGTRVYSKAGWTRRWAHDAAWIIGPEGSGVEMVLVVCSEQRRKTPHVAWIAGEVYRALTRAR